LLVTALLLPLAAFCQQAAVPLKPFEAVEAHMGTLFRIKLYAANQQQAQGAFRAAFDRIAQLDDTLSDYKPESELSRLSTDAVGHPDPVSADLFEVVASAQELARQTAGAFDITLGPVIRLWRAARKTGNVPTSAALDQARSRCGYHLLKLNSASRTIELEKPGMALDVGGIAKGYAADEALAVLQSKGIHSALVAASGDLTFSDAPPGRPGWKIGLDSFDKASAPFTKILILKNAAISTSGDTEQHLDTNGKRYSHIINPKTDMGLTDPVTVSIVAPRGIVADSVATAVDVLGPEKGMAFVNGRPDVAALIVIRTAKAPRVLESERFRELPGAAGTPN
jgi:thiamine biosynthesis lipoprotein